MNIATLFDGPARVAIDGTFIEPRANVRIEYDPRLINVETAAFGKATDYRTPGPAITVSFTPSGQWASGFRDVLLPAHYLDGTRGRVLAPRVIDVTSINTSTDVLTTPTHGFTTADPTLAATTNTFPTLSSGSLSAATTYYVRALTTTTLSLHPTASDATNNTNALNFTGSGTGTLRLVRMQPVIVHGHNGDKWAFNSGGLLKLPNLKLTPREPMFGEVQLGIFTKLNTTPETAGSLYTQSATAFTDTSFTAPSQVIMQPYTATLGGTALQLDGPVEVEWELDTKPVDSPTYGLYGVQHQDFGATIKLPVVGMTSAALAALTSLEARPGSALSSGALTLQGAGSDFLLTFAGTAIDKPTLNFDPQGRLIGPLTLKAKRAISGGSASAMATLALS